ncbi:MAG: efflux RND transporter periplasmic adaptor subunit [Capsulimonadaceae bacterium]
MKKHQKNSIALALIVGVAASTSWTVHHFHRQGHVDVIAAQAMDMTRMRPPVGAAPVAVATVRVGDMDDSVTYTGSVEAYNEQDVSPRITGTVLSLPVYPGDSVRAGQLLAQLDSAAVSEQTAQANAEAHAAQMGEQVAHLTHHLHHSAALNQANSQLAAAQQSVSDAQDAAEADEAAVVDALAEVRSVTANAEYWRAELAREKQLADAGAVSRAEYQNEQAQAQAASAAVDQGEAKVTQARATERAAQAGVIEANRQVDVARAGVQMAIADITVADSQAQEAGATAVGAEAAAREAAVVQSYTRITSPVNGVVIVRPIAPGTLVQPGTVLLKIAEIDQVRVQANVAVTDLAGIHVCRPVRIVPQDGGPAIDAHVTSVFPSVDTDTRTGIVEAVIPNPGHRLLPGAYVAMRIVKHTDRNSLLVPADAVVTQGGQSTVWTIRAESGPTTAHQVIVQVAGTDGASAEVVSGHLGRGDKVVVRGLAGLSEGERVVATDWGPNGPISLPVAVAGPTLYRCEKCGMTYSEADARKNHFVDPMDGGKLVPVTAGSNPDDRL